jgi:hypothetical protein
VGAAAGRVRRRRVALAVLVAWLGLEVVTGAGHAGLAERVLGLAQALWPLTVAVLPPPARAPIGHAPSAA